MYLHVATQTLASTYAFLYRQQQEVDVTASPEESRSEMDVINKEYVSYDTVVQDTLPLHVTVLALYSI